MSGFGGASTTHDVGDRLTWFLSRPVSKRRPAWQDNMVRMQAFAWNATTRISSTTFYADADKGVEASTNGRERAMILSSRLKRRAC